MQMNRGGVRVVRCTVERLMRRLGLEGVLRARKVRTTLPDASAPCLLDRVNRVFKARRPNELGVSDFTYVSTWAGVVVRRLRHRRVRPAHRGLARQ
jgi:transposase InsO family protein